MKKKVKREGDGAEIRGRDKVKGGKGAWQRNLGKVSSSYRGGDLDTKKKRGRAVFGGKKNQQSSKDSRTEKESRRTLPEQRENPNTLRRLSFKSAAKNPRRWGKKSKGEVRSLQQSRKAENFQWREKALTDSIKGET